MKSDRMQVDIGICVLRYTYVFCIVPLIDLNFFYVIAQIVNYKLFRNIEEKTVTYL